MPVEIRELHIKGSVTGGSNPVKENFSKLNSPLLNTQFVRQLTRDIKEECIEEILEILERKNFR